MTPTKPFKVEPMIIVFCGYKGSGKDTCAHAFRLHLSRCQYVIPKALVSQQVNFADKVKEVCADLFSMSLNQMVDPTLKEVPLKTWPYQTPRHILQQFASEGIRTIWPDLWVHHWIKRTQLELRTGNIVVATDMRFPNERNAVETLASDEGIPFAIINVERPPQNGMTGKIDTHMSESYVGKLEHHTTIVNGGSVKDLEELVPAKIAEALKIYRTQKGRGT